MDNLQILIDRAKELENSGNPEAALQCYNDTLDSLFGEADDYARQLKGSIIDVGKTRSMMPKFFDEVKKYLKRDITAAIISNNMGKLLSKLGRQDDAKEMFNQAIDLTPDSQEYLNPVIGIKKFNNKPD